MPAMVLTRRRLLLVSCAFAAIAATAAASGCADTDPRYGPPEAIRGRQDRLRDRRRHDGHWPTERAGGNQTPRRSLHAVRVRSILSDVLRRAHQRGGQGGTFFVGADRGEACVRRGSRREATHQDLTAPATEGSFFSERTAHGPGAARRGRRRPPSRRSWSRRPSLRVRRRRPPDGRAAPTRRRVPAGDPSTCAFSCRPTRSRGTRSRRAGSIPTRIESKSGTDVFTPSAPARISSARRLSGKHANARSSGTSA